MCIYLLYLDDMAIVLLFLIHSSCLVSNGFDGENELSTLEPESAFDKRWIPLSR